LWLFHLDSILVDRGVLMVKGGEHPRHNIEDEQEATRRTEEIQAKPKYGGSGTRKVFGRWLRDYYKHAVETPGLLTSPPLQRRYKEIASRFSFPLDLKG
jgi:hypothetical protein